jgi:hypothetical protein
MTTQRDIERLLYSWLGDGPDAVADRVIDAMADRIEHQSQRPAWQVHWRDSHVNTNLRPLAAIAAVIVLAVAGLAVIVGLTSRGGVAAPGTSATPSVSAGATSTASPVAASSAAAFSCYGDTTGCAGPLTAGQHVSANFLLALTFTTPDGWVNVRDIPRTYGIETDLGVVAPIEVMGLNAIAEQTDACGPIRKPGVGSSVEDLIAAVRSHPGLTATDPVAAEIDGFKGQSIDFGVKAPWDKRCPAIDSDFPVVLMLTDTGEPPGRTIGYTVNQRVRWTVLDVRGETIIVELVGPAGASEFTSSLVAAQAVVDTFKFGPTR